MAELRISALCPDSEGVTNISIEEFGRSWTVATASPQHVQIALESELDTLNVCDLYYMYIILNGTVVYECLEGGFVADFRRSFSPMENFRVSKILLQALY